MSSVQLSAKNSYYTLRRSCPKHTPTGLVYQYAWKEYEAPEESAREPQRKRLERGVSKFPRMEDCLVCVGFEDGAVVRRQSVGAPLYHDASPEPGEVVGCLRKRGRRWVVIDVEDELDRSADELVRYAVRNHMWVYVEEEPPPAGSMLEMVATDFWEATNGHVHTDQSLMDARLIDRTADLLTALSSP